MSGDVEALALETDLVTDPLPGVPRHGGGPRHQGGGGRGHRGHGARPHHDGHFTWMMTSSSSL